MFVDDEAAVVDAAIVVDVAINFHRQRRGCCSLGCVDSMRLHVDRQQWRMDL